MTQNITQIYEKPLGALDGPIGRVKDVYFDDESWDVRYLVADTGTWLEERLVLLSPHAFCKPAIGESSGIPNVLRVNLTRQQIEDSPSIATHRPVSRQFQEEYHRHFGWPSYWEAGGTWGVSGRPVIAFPPSPESGPRSGRPHHEDVHLRNTRSLMGYRVFAVDGTIGHLRDFIVDDDTWTLRELIVETRRWFSTRRLRIRASDINRISYEEAAVYVRLTKAETSATSRRPVAQTPALHH